MLLLAPMVLKVTREYLESMGKPLAYQNTNAASRKAAAGRGGGVIENGIFRGTGWTQVRHTMFVSAAIPSLPCGSMKVLRVGGSC